MNEVQISLKLGVLLLGNCLNLTVAFPGELIHACLVLLLKRLKRGEVRVCSDDALVVALLRKRVSTQLLSFAKVVHTLKVLLLCARQQLS